MLCPIEDVKLSRLSDVRSCSFRTHWSICCTACPSVAQNSFKMAFSVAARAQTAAPVLGARKAAVRPGKQRCCASVGARGCNRMAGKLTSNWCFVQWLPALWPASSLCTPGGSIQAAMKACMLKQTTLQPMDHARRKHRAGLCAAGMAT
jgi:hypothetical protein